MYLPYLILFTTCLLLALLIGFLVPSSNQGAKVGYAFAGIFGLLALVFIAWALYNFGSQLYWTVPYVILFVICLFIGLMIGFLVPAGNEGTKTGYALAGIFTFLAVIGIVWAFYNYGNNFSWLRFVPNFEYEAPREPDNYFWTKCGFFGLLILGLIIGLAVSIPEMTKNSKKEAETNISFISALVAVFVLVYLFKRPWTPIVVVLGMLAYIVYLCVAYAPPPDSGKVNRAIIIAAFVVPAVIMIAAMLNINRITKLTNLPTNLLGIGGMIVYILIVGILVLVNPGKFMGSNFDPTNGSNLMIVTGLCIFSVIVIYMNQFFFQQKWTNYFSRFGIMITLLLVASFAFQYAIRALIAAPNEQSTTDKVMLYTIILSFCFIFFNTVMPWLPKPFWMLSASRQYLLAYIYCTSIDVSQSIVNSGALKYVMILEIVLIVFYAFSKRLYTKLQEGGLGSQLFNEPVALNVVTSVDVSEAAKRLRASVPADFNVGKNIDLGSAADKLRASIPANELAKATEKLRAGIPSEDFAKATEKLRASMPADEFAKVQAEVAKATDAIQAKTIADSDSAKFLANYAISFWLFLTPQPKDHDPDHTSFVNVLDYGGKPSVKYNAALNTLRITVVHTGSKQTIFAADISKIPLQRWHHLVLAYNNGTFDVFLNGVLYRSVPNVVTDAFLEPVVIGAIEGNRGNQMCNVVFFQASPDPKYSFTKNVDSINVQKVLSLYNQFINKTPPIVTRILEVYPTPSYASIRLF